MKTHTLIVLALGLFAVSSAPAQNPLGFGSPTPTPAPASTPRPPSPAQITYLESVFPQQAGAKLNSIRAQELQIYESLLAFFQAGPYLTEQQKDTSLTYLALKEINTILSRLYIWVTLAGTAPNDYSGHPIPAPPTLTLTGSGTTIVTSGTGTLTLSGTGVIVTDGTNAPFTIPIVSGS